MNSSSYLSEKALDNIRHAAKRYAAFFQSFTPSDLERFAEYFTADARFKDPFNDVRGLAAIRAVFAHMYKPCPLARFTVHDVALEQDTAYLRWTFVCTDQLSIDGVSRVVFDHAGRVREHVDYWDAAEQVYAHLPLIGGLFRWLQRRLAVKA